jgi:uncharacterized protein YcnI
VKRTLLTLALVGAATAQAHVTLEVPQAPAGSSFRAVFRIGHGCAGSATNLLSVRIPAGFRGAKPMPKPGWTVAITRNADTVSEITWRASSREAWIEDAYYDEFVLRVQLPEQPGAQVFPVVQGCEKGQAEWETPLTVLPASAAPGGHMH